MSKEEMIAMIIAIAATGVVVLMFVSILLAEYIDYVKRKIRANKKEELRTSGKRKE